MLHVFGGFCPTPQGACRLKYVSAQSQLSFPWIMDSCIALYYVVNLIPQDLRSVNLPLYTRLSSASTGLPGNDFADLGIIREEWIRSRTRDIVQQGRRRIKYTISRLDNIGVLTSQSLRIGTFNVNGKFPSQDLASWIRGTMWGANASKIILPQPKTSPLVGRDSFDSGKYSFVIYSGITKHL